jgi:quaternary ammonium compound-resistance protein SugE
MAWVYLFIASLLEIAWTFSLKYLDFKKIMAIHWSSFFSDRQNFMALVPLLGYIIFGAANVYFFALSMKELPTSVALAAWMGIALIGIILVEISILKQPWHASQLFFVGLIIVGIIGLKRGMP